MASRSTQPALAVGDHEAFMEYALEQAQKSPPAANKFCVGAVLVDADKGEVLSTGYSLEYPRDYKGDLGTTHAEQCCFIKVADEHNLPEERIAEVLPPNTVLYTTMEPCNERLSGNTTCATRILRLNGAIKTVYVGIREPRTFIVKNDGQKRLEEGGVKVVFPVEHMHDRIIEISMAGHPKPYPWIPPTR
jgi:pyrimidine deaminase RibD-like protein